MDLWYCFRPSNRGTVKAVEKVALFGRWSFARVDEENSRLIRPVVIGNGIKT